MNDVLDRSEQQIPATPCVMGEEQAKHLADSFVKEHAPHVCVHCGNCRPVPILNEYVAFYQFDSVAGYFADTDGSHRE